MSATTHRPVCRHCHSAPISRPRRLCWNWYYSPGVRELYPSTGKFGYRGPGNVYRNARPALAPTSAPPGTAQKIAILQTRLALGVSLHHPGDATFMPR